MKATRLLLLLLPAAAATLAAPAAPAPAAPVRRTADLRSFFHGDAPPAKAPPPAATATVATAAGAAVDPQVEGFLRAFADALKARDGDRLRPRLAATFTIPDLPEGLTAPALFVQGVNQTPGPLEIVIQSVEVKGPARVAKATFRYADRTTVKILKFDAEGRLLATDLFKVKVETHGI